MTLSTSSFTRCRIFRSLLWENRSDYDAQNFRIFIPHHCLPPHLKRKKIHNMLRCTSQVLTWNNPAGKDECCLKVTYSLIPTTNLQNYKRNTKEGNLGMPVIAYMCAHMTASLLDVLMCLSSIFFFFFFFFAF